MERILIVDDERGVRDSLQAILRDEGFQADAVATGEECLARLESQEYDAVLLDIWLPVQTYGGDKLFVGPVNLIGEFGSAVNAQALQINAATQGQWSAVDGAIDSYGPGRFACDVLVY